jgi:hypothetical protein
MDVLPKFGNFSQVYVPAVIPDQKNVNVSLELRPFETLIPFLAKYNLNVNSYYTMFDAESVSAAIEQESGDVLVAWEHSQIPQIAKYLGVVNPPKWHGSDFDSVWIITYPNHSGYANLEIESEGISPIQGCGNF